MKVFLLIVLSVAQKGLAQEVTHFPTEQDPEHARDVQKALKNAVPDKECEELLMGEATSIIRVLLYTMGSSSRPIEPCGSCFVEGLDSWTIVPGEVRTAKYRNGLIMQLPGETNSSRFLCTSCNIVDDCGNKQTGNITFIWTGGKLNFTITRTLEKKVPSVKFLLPMADNINNNSVQAICEGNDDFQAVCNETHQSGVLDSVFANSGVRVFLKDEPAAGKEAYKCPAKYQKMLKRAFACKRPM